MSRTVESLASSLAAKAAMTTSRLAEAPAARLPGRRPNPRRLTCPPVVRFNAGRSGARTVNAKCLFIGVAFLGWRTAVAAPPIDYSALYVGRHAPPGAMAKLREAARLAISRADCKHATAGAYLPASQRDRNHRTAPYFVTCSDPTKAIDPGARNFYFTDADLRAGRVEHQPVPVPRTQAIELCLDAVRQRLQYPSSAKFSGWRAQAGLGGTLNWRIMIPFTALNGLGNRVPGRGVCVVEPDQHVDVSLEHR